MNLFDRYLLSRFFSVFFVMMASVFGLFVVIDGFTNVDSFTEGDGDFGQIAVRILSFYACQAVVFFDMSGAIVATCGVMIVFALLLKHSELYPVLAAGVPTLRLVRPIVVGVLLVNGLLVANRELLIPRVYETLQAPRSSNEQFTKKIEPVYDRRTHVHIDGERLVVSEGRMKGATIVLPTTGPLSGLVSELTTLKADHAFWIPASADQPSGWELRDPEPPFSELKLTQAGRTVVLPTHKGRRVLICTDLSPNQLFNRNRNFKYLSTPELIQRLHSSSAADTTSEARLVHLHSRLVTPLLNVVVVFIAVPLIVRRESRSLVVNMAVSSCVLGVVYGVTQLLLFCSQGGLLAADLAVWLPVVGCGSLGAWLSGHLLT